MAAPSPASPPPLVRLAHLLLAAGCALAGAALISPWFKTPFVVILGRMLFLALVLLLVFGATRRLPERWLPAWLPRWGVALVGVVVAAPVATLLAYLLTLDGDFGAFVASEPHVAGFVRTATTGLVIGLLVTLAAYLRLQALEARSRELQFALEREQLERQAERARADLLQAQIEPHFLFNTLANVQALVETGSPRAAPVLQSLIDYLRAAMPRLHDGPATLRQELERVRAYLALMQMRMPDRLAFEVQAEPGLLDQPCPPMALLTLVENAVRHGIDPLEQGGRIEVRAQGQAPGWTVTVDDDGAGLDPHRRPGTGLANLRERLATLHGAAASLELEERSPRGVRARLQLPRAS